MLLGWKACLRVSCLVYRSMRFRIFGVSWRKLLVDRIRKLRLRGLSCNYWQRNDDQGKDAQHHFPIS